ncbi:penicillin acylase family protein [Pseudohalioglobus sediminis]|uniref:Penicillin acylase family protein n=1 Tax=Pseudohalioglobus sediminis TaxID=2606449 RepID=A0A5B0WRN9_9GAMM|nr:penicillin acylase family protein [Pseudohalioglobus sediminis]KAA1189546.1 penicillin acylase family protein [Pseudohalioglobus sediminis]
MKKWLLLLLVIAAGLAWYVPRIDAPQRDGAMTVASLQGEVRVLRGADGVPYLYAESLDDVLTAQGFLHAQDRLFQLELHRYLSHGRLAEFIGERGLRNDRIVRLVDIPGFARDYATRISSEERNYLQRYVNGINDYIASRSDEFPLMLGVMGHTVQPWTLEDVVAVTQFRIWSSSVNWKQELLTLRLYDELGPERASQLAPIAVNPDDPRTLPEARNEVLAQDLAAIDLSYDDSLFSPLQPRYAMGSDAWATGPQKSAGAAPILSSDPHMDARHLPGFWYPMGAVTPELRIVGGSTPGNPGWGIGRTDHIAWGATNGYADVVDLYLEVVDPQNPQHYLEGERSLPFEVREEILRIRDKEAEGGYRTETMTIRATRRGPVISDHGMSMAEGRVLSLRWSTPLYALPDAGNRELMLARSVDEAIAAMSRMTTPLNHVVIDVDGNIAMVPTGMVPLRTRGNGLVPLQVTGEDNWQGRIPHQDMPIQRNPQRQWVGSTNHRVTSADYPFAYSTHFSPRWRYVRLQELMQRDVLDADDHWRANQDIVNTLARRLRPLLLDAFASDPVLAPLARLLQDWDLRDDKDAAAPLVFQSVFRHLAGQVFADDMSEDLLRDYLDEQYYWVERFVYLLETDDPAWIDDSRTDEVETSADLLRRAGRDALAELSAAWGSDPDAWRWGDAHTITLFHPFIPGERAAGLIGGGTHPMDGSSETLNRGMYKFSEAYRARIVDSVRMVVDLSDTEKVTAHYPGGVSERWFDPWNKTFAGDWLSGERRYWWFSDSAIDAHTDTELLLRPTASP